MENGLCLNGRVVTDEDTVNGRSSESHQVYLNGRVVTDEDTVKSLYSTRPDYKSARTGFVFFMRQ